MSYESDIAIIVEPPTRVRVLDTLFPSPTACMTIPTGGAFQDAYYGAMAHLYDEDGNMVGILQTDLNVSEIRAPAVPGNNSGGGGSNPALYLYFRFDNLQVLEPGRYTLELMPWGIVDGLHVWFNSATTRAFDVMTVDANVAAQTGTDDEANTLEFLEQYA